MLEALKRSVSWLMHVVKSAPRKRRAREEGEHSLAAVADWGPAEDWSDWD